MKVAHQGQLMLSIGALLAAEREKRGIPVERAAKETRMRPQRIRDMESDDLSHFTNPSYARMFLIAYAKYLGIPMQTIRDHLPDRGEPGTEGYNYIHAAAETLPSLRKNLTSQPLKKSHGLRLLLSIVAVVVLLGLALLGSYIYVNLNRLVDKTPSQNEKTPVLTNLQPGADKSSTLETQMQIAAPPAPSATPILSATASASATPAADTTALAPNAAGATPVNAATAEAPAPSPEAAAPAASATPTSGAAKPADSPSAADRAFLLGTPADQKPAATPQ
jgi:cytoskeleton protein RodZ